MNARGEGRARRWTIALVIAGLALVAHHYGPSWRAARRARQIAECTESGGTWRPMPEGERCLP